MLFLTTAGHRGLRCASLCELEVKSSQVKSQVKFIVYGLSSFPPRQRRVRSVLSVSAYSRGLGIGESGESRPAARRAVLSPPFYLSGTVCFLMHVISSLRNQGGLPLVSVRGIFSGIIFYGNLGPRVKQPAG